MIVFFDDILAYIQNLKDHLMHLKIVLETLGQQQLHALKFKSKFGCSKIEYLGHIISKEGVKACP